MRREDAERLLNDVERLMPIGVGIQVVEASASSGSQRPPGFEWEVHVIVRDDPSWDRLVMSLHHADTRLAQCKYCGESTRKDDPEVIYDAISLDCYHAACLPKTKPRAIRGGEGWKDDRLWP